MTTPLATLQTTLVNAGIWAKLDCLQVYAQPLRADAVKNLIDVKKFKATEVAAPNFFENVGFAGTGVSGYINTNFNPSTAGLLSSVDDCCMFVWSQEDQLTSKYFSGAYVGSNQTLIAYGSTTTVASGINQTSSNVSAATVPHQMQLLAVDKSGSAGSTLYAQGASIATQTTYATTGLLNGNIFIGGRSNSGSLANATTQPTVGVFGYGKSLSSGEHATLYAALKAYMTEIGYLSRPVACWGDSITAVPTNTAYPEMMLRTKLPNRRRYQGGVSGETSTQIKVRMLADTTHTDHWQIIWAGRNNYTDSATVLADIAAMVARAIDIGARYLVLSIINGSTATEYSGGSDYNKIIAINNQLAILYPDNYYDIRAAFVAAYDPLQAQDVIDFGRDVPPLSLRADFLHPNAAGAIVIANLVAQWLYQYDPHPLPDAGDVLSGVDRGDGVTGTYQTVSTVNVRSGTDFGDAGSQTGTLIVPAVSDVVAGVGVDATVGTYVTVDESNVNRGITFGPSGSLTGTLATALQTTSDAILTLLQGWSNDDDTAVIAELDSATQAQIDNIETIVETIQTSLAEATVTVTGYASIDTDGVLQLKRAETATLTFTSDSANLVPDLSAGTTKIVMGIKDTAGRVWLSLTGTVLVATGLQSVRFVLTPTLSLALIKGHHNFDVLAIYGYDAGSTPPYASLKTFTSGRVTVTDVYLDPLGL